MDAYNLLSIIVFYSLYFFQILIPLTLSSDINDDQVFPSAVSSIFGL
jgi:hypothetical protein